jgi:hypothetical protein
VKTRRQHTTTELTGDSADATNNGYYATRTDTQDIARSPLAKLLFAIDGVKAVYLGPEKKKQKKRNANPTHVHVPGVDPSHYFVVVVLMFITMLIAIAIAIAIAFAITITMLM